MTTTVGRIRRDDKKRKQQKTARLAIGKVGVLVIVLVVLLAATAIVYFSPAFSVTKVRVDGAWHLTDARISTEAAVPSDSTLLRLDADGITARLKADPWIADVKVERQFPETLVLNITERTALARVEIAPQSATVKSSSESAKSSEWLVKSSEWLVSSDNIWLGLTDSLASAGVAIDADELKALPLIKDVLATVVPGDGAEVYDEGVLNAVKLLGEFSPQMRALVTNVSAPDKAKTTLGLTNAVGVAFGAAEDVAVKETAIATLLETYAGKLTYINVRVADKPTYRTTGV